MYYTGLQMMTVISLKINNFYYQALNLIWELFSLYILLTFNKSISKLTLIGQRNPLLSFEHK